jgi:hypothetical protein
MPTHAISFNEQPANSTTGDLQFPYKSYIAILTQSGEDAPVATVVNSTDSNYLGDIVWTRNANPGNYLGTKADAFTLNKTWASISVKGDSALAGAVKLNNTDTIAYFTNDQTFTGVDDETVYIQIIVMQ